MRYIFVDFEMNPVHKSFADIREYCRQEIIEIGAVMLDEDYREISTYRQYVRPLYGTVQPKITEITGITDDMLKDSPVFADAIGAFLDWCGEDYEIYAWGDSDLRVLLGETDILPEPDERLLDIDLVWFDFQQIFIDLLGLQNRISLQHAVGAAENSFNGKAHDAMWDAKNTADLFRLSQDQALFEQKMEPILSALRPSQSPKATIGDQFASMLSAFQE